MVAFRDLGISRAFTVETSFLGARHAAGTTSPRDALFTPPADHSGTADGPKHYGPKDFKHIATIICTMCEDLFSSAADMRDRFISDAPDISRASKPVSAHIDQQKEHQKRLLAIRNRKNQYLDAARELAPMREKSRGNRIVSRPMRIKASATISSHGKRGRRRRRHRQARSMRQLPRLDDDVMTSGDASSAGFRSDNDVDGLALADSDAAYTSDEFYSDESESSGSDSSPEEDCLTLAQLGASESFRALVTLRKDTVPSSDFQELFSQLQLTSKPPSVDRKEVITAKQAPPVKLTDASRTKTKQGESHGPTPAPAPAPAPSPAPSRPRRLSTARARQLRELRQASKEALTAQPSRPSPIRTQSTMETVSALLDNRRIDTRTNALWPMSPTEPNPKRDADSWRLKKSPLANRPLASVPDRRSLLQGDARAATVRRRHLHARTESAGIGSESRLLGLLSGGVRRQVGGADEVREPLHDNASVTQSAPTSPTKRSPVAQRLLSNFFGGSAPRAPPAAPVAAAPRGHRRRRHLSGECSRVRLSCCDCCVVVDCVVCVHLPTAARRVDEAQAEPEVMSATMSRTFLAATQPKVANTASRRGAQLTRLLEHANAGLGRITHRSTKHASFN